MGLLVLFFFFKQKTAKEMRISGCSSDVCSSDLLAEDFDPARGRLHQARSDIQQRGLAASCRPDDGDELAGLDQDGGVLDRRIEPTGPSPCGEGAAYIVQGNGGA